MKQCKCGSYAFNLYKEDIDQGDLCDVHYWKEKALAQPEQRSVSEHLEPVAIPDDVRKIAKSMQKDGYRGPLSWAQTVIDFVADYTAPPQRTWVGLTDDEKLHIEIMGGKSDVMLAEMVEAKLKEKNNA